MFFGVGEVVLAVFVCFGRSLSEEEAAVCLRGDKTKEREKEGTVTASVLFSLEGEREGEPSPSLLVVFLE